MDIFGNTFIDFLESDEMIDAESTQLKSGDNVASLA